MFYIVVVLAIVGVPFLVMIAATAGSRELTHDELFPKNGRGGTVSKEDLLLAEQQRQSATLKQIEIQTHPRNPWRKDD